MAGSVYLLLIAPIILGGHAERNFKFHIEKYVLQKMDSEYIDVLNCRLTQLNNRSYVSAELILHRSVSQLDVRGILDLIKNDKQKVRLFDVRLEGCGFLENVYKKPLFKILMVTMKRHTNVRIRCPLQPNFNYTISNMYFDEQDFPINLPNSKFQGQWDFEYKNKLLVRMILSVEVIRN